MPENIKNIIFECLLIMPPWRKMSLILEIDVTWKIVMIGVILNSYKNLILESILLFIAYKIQKYEMKCGNLNEYVSYESMRCFKKNALMQLYHTVNKLKYINLN